MQLRPNALVLGLTAITALVAAACSCTVESTTTGSGGEGGEAASGGKGGKGGGGGSSGKGGGGSAGKGTGGSAGTGSGGKGGAGSGGSGEGGEGGAGVVDCTDAETLPDTVDEDLTVGPGCVRIDRTTVTAGATLTIEPGTTVMMAAAGYLGVATGGDNSALVSVGTATNPITFTSEALDPQPGDWQCVHVGGNSSASDVRFTTFEYGGAACDTTGAGYEGMVQLGSAARAVSNNTFRNSLTYGVLIHTDGAVRAFDDNTFAGNMDAGISVSSKQLLVLGDGLTFPSDDRIDVDTTFALDSSGNWRGQSVPFRVPSGMAIGGNAEVTMDPGVRVEFTGGSLEVFGANLIVAGTEADPVVFSSALANPMAGDWGCIHFSSPTGTPRFDHAIVEYAGNGQGCTGAEYETALYVPDNTVITNSAFADIAGSAIRTSDACPTDEWCLNTFEDTVEVGPLECEFGPVVTACP